MAPMYLYRHGVVGCMVVMLVPNKISRVHIVVRKPGTWAN
jgi:hypothetical protein